MSEHGPFIEVVPGRWKLRKEITVGELVTLALVLMALLWAWFDYGYRIKALEAGLTEQQAGLAEQQRNHAAIILFLQQQEEFPAHRHIDGALLYPRGRAPDAPPTRRFEKIPPPAGQEQP